jgi:hypothetical protein
MHFELLFGNRMKARRFSSIFLSSSEKSDFEETIKVQSLKDFKDFWRKKNESRLISQHLAVVKTGHISRRNVISS